MKYFILYLIFVLGIFFYSSWIHEQAHGSIFNEDGINVTYKYHWNYFETIGEKPCQSQVCSLSQNFNEIITYNLQGFFLLIAAGFGIIILILEAYYDSLR